MDTSSNILVIILSAALAVFLILAIIVAILIIRLMHTINRIAEKAEKVVDTVESVGRVFQHVSGPLAATKLLHNIIDSVTKHRQGD